MKDSEKVALLRIALSELIDIVEDSAGVVGYHLNGNVAHWVEFVEVQNAFAALDATKGEDHE